MCVCVCVCICTQFSMVVELKEINVSAIERSAALRTSEMGLPREVNQLSRMTPL